MATSAKPVDEIEAGMRVFIGPDEFQFAEVLSNPEAYGKGLVVVFHTAPPQHPPIPDHTVVLILADEMVSGFVFPNDYTLQVEED